MGEDVGFEIWGMTRVGGKWGEIIWIHMVEGFEDCVCGDEHEGRFDRMLEWNPGNERKTRFWDDAWVGWHALGMLSLDYS